MRMKKVLCFGELLLRISPALHGEWIKQARMNVYVGGAELNVANALARWHIQVKYFTAIPDNYLSKEIVEQLQENNIDISAIKFSGNRIGTYYLPQGTDLKNAGVIYDRAASSFSELKTGTIDWDEVLRDVEWFHFSAICPALSEDAASLCKEALEAASQKGLVISTDLNYRSKLWQYGKQPLEIMPGLVQYCNVIMGNIWSAGTLLGINADTILLASDKKEAYLQQAQHTALEIMNQYSQCSVVAHTFRFDIAEGVRYYASFNNRDDAQYVSQTFNVEHVIDKVGTGDCFMAGLIYGISHAKSPQHIINFAAAAAVGKMHEVGDCTQQTIADIERKAFSK
ncbi:sugar kinase [soil metagenome]